MVDDSAMAAAAAIVQSLAADPTAPMSLPLRKDTGPIQLPGRDTPGKRQLEAELARLAKRIDLLEARAQTANTTFPETPNEANDSLFGDDSTGTSPDRNGRATARPKLQREGTQADPRNGDSPLTDQALESLQEKVLDQEKGISSARQEITSVSAQLLEQKELQEQAFSRIEQDRVARLERELWKHQKANEAFQKALREIGEIVTAVARGDLSKKVRMNSVEMDPEISTFKRTINTMVDQLQVFSSEVARVAREVGTEGLLGGQARIEGVDGTWKELTDNGTMNLAASQTRRQRLTMCSERYGPEFDGSR